MLAAETIFAALALDGSAADAELARYDERVRASWVWDELHRGRNFSAGIAKLGTLLGGGARVRRAEPAAGPRAVDAAQSQRGPRAITAAAAAAPRPAVSEARRRRRHSIARAPCSCRARRTKRISRAISSSRIRRCRSREPAAVRRARAALLPGRRLRGRRGCDGRRAFPDQRDELRALQDLRHQGPGAEHHVGAARRRRRPELLRHVAPAAGARSGSSRCASIARRVAAISARAVGSVAGERTASQMCTRSGPGPRQQPARRQLPARAVDHDRHDGQLRARRGGERAEMKRL